MQFKKGQIVRYSDGLNHMDYKVVKATKKTLIVQRFFPGFEFESQTVLPGEWHRFCQTQREAMIEALRDEIEECGMALSDLSGEEPLASRDIRNIKRRAENKLRKLLAK